MLKREARSLDADSRSKVDWGTEIRGDQSLRALVGDGLGSCIEQRARANGDAVDGAGRMHGNGYSDRAAEKETKTGIAGSDLLRRTSCRAAHGVDQTGNCVPL